MPYLYHSNLADIMLSMRDRIVSKGIMPAERVVVTMQIFPMPTTLDRFIAIMPLRERVDDEITSQAGRYFTVVTALIDVYVYVRMSLDKINQDLLWLTKESTGALRIRDKVISVLHRWFDRRKMVEPLQLVDTMEPRKYGPGRDWGFVYTTFYAKYALDLDPIYDPYPGQLEP